MLNHRFSLIVMKKFFFFLGLSLLVTGVSSCNGTPPPLVLYDGTIYTALLGYESEVEGSGRGFEHDDFFQGEHFIPFVDKESMERAKEGGVQKEEGYGAELPKNRLEFSEDNRELVVKVYPRQEDFRSFELTSSDKSIIEVISISGNKAVVRTHDLGEATLRMKVHGAKNDITAEIPMMVVTTVDVNLYITPFWEKKTSTNRIRYKVCSKPSFLGDMVYQVMDSVRVVAKCSYYDFRIDRSERIIRDTVKLPFDEFYDRYHKNTRLRLRNLSNTFSSIRKRTHEGTRYSGDDIVKYKYKFDVEQVILDFFMVCESPYVDFAIVTKSESDSDDDRPSGKKVGEDYMDDGIDTESILAENDVFRFVVLLNSFAGDSEKQALAADLQRKLEDLNYNAELSEEEKNKRIEELNKHKKDKE